MKRSILIFFVLSIALGCNQDVQPSPKVTTNNQDTSLKIRVDSIDALKASPANFKLLLENEHVRVLEYTLHVGEKDQWHTHPAKSSYVLSGGKLKVYLENSAPFLAEDSTGTAVWMDAVGKHYVENVGTTPVKIILTEVKSSMQ